MLCLALGDGEFRGRLRHLRDEPLTGVLGPRKRAFAIEDVVLRALDLQTETCQLALCLGAIDAGDRLVGGQLVARRAKDLGDGYRHRRHDGVGVGRPKQTDERFADDWLRVAGRLYDASRQSGRRRDSRDDQNRHDAGAGCGRMAV